MKSINKIKSMNKLLEDKKEKLKKELKEVQELIEKVNDEIDLEEVSSLSYAEIKELFNDIKFYLSDEIRNKISKIMEETKIKENPQLEGVHYFPILKEIKCIPEHLKKKIDNDLRKVSVRGKNNQLLLRLLEEYKKEFDFYEELKDELINKNVIEPLYIFTCKECDDEYDDDVVESKTFEKMKNYWKKCSNNIETTEEEDEECNYGYIEVAFECDSYEIGSLDEFFENLANIEYKMSMLPDLTLEKL